MSTAAPSHQADGRRTSGRRTPLLPPQHGAWAFLALPMVLACAVTPPTWWTALLALAWFAAYPASYAGGRLLHDRRPERFRRPFVAWSVLAAVPTALVVVRFPWLLGPGVVLLALVAINATYARRNDERALVNDLVVVTECALLVPITWGVNASVASLLDGVPTEVLVLAVVCWLVLAGSTLHVKSLIRERRDPRYARASRAFALGSLIASLGLALVWGPPQGAWLVLPFVAMAVRAFVVGRRTTRAVVIGLVELAMVVLTAVACWLA